MRAWFAAAVAAVLLSTSPAAADPKPAADSKGQADPRTGTSHAADDPDCAAAVVFVDDRCPPPARVWGGAEFLLWWLQDSNLPFLATTGSEDDDLPGAVGQPGTELLFGGNVNHEPRGGARFTAGTWLDDGRGLGVEGSFFFLGARSVGFSGGSAGDPILAAPVFDTALGAERAVLIAFPDLQAGAGRIDLASRLWGFELNGRTEACRHGCHSLELLAGFRHADLDEALRINTLVVPLPDSPFFGLAQVVGSAGRFYTRNQFYGGQLGGEATFYCDYWRDVFFALRAKVALGTNRETVAIKGNTVLANGPVAVPVPGGPLALQSNIGRYGRNEFAVVPELGVKTGIQLTPAVRATVGYTFLYWSDVARPGEQIDRAANPNQIPPPLGPGVPVGPARPAFAFRPTEFWAQGLDVGLEFRY